MGTLPQGRRADVVSVLPTASPYRNRDGGLRSSVPVALFDGSAAPLMNLKSKIPKHSSPGGPRARSRPMEASKKYHKDAKRRVGGLSTVLAMTEPVGPLPSAVPESVPVAAAPGALAAMGALHEEVRTPPPKSPSAHTVFLP